MPKVTLNKSTKIKGKGLVLAGVEIDVTAEQKKQLEKDGFLGEVKKDNSPGNEKEIKALVKKAADLEKELGVKDELILAKDEEIKELKAKVK